MAMSSAVLYHGIFSQSNARSSTMSVSNPRVMRLMSVMVTVIIRVLVIRTIIFSMTVLDGVVGSSDCMQNTMYYQFHIQPRS